MLSTVVQHLFSGIKITAKHVEKSYNDIIEIDPRQTDDVVALFNADFKYMANHLQVAKN